VGVQGAAVRQERTSTEGGSKKGDGARAGPQGWWSTEKRIWDTSMERGLSEEKGNTKDRERENYG